MKNLFPALFLAKLSCDRLGKGEKNLVPSSVHTQPRQENSKKNSKKIQKIKKKPLFGIIYSQNEMRQAEKGRKKF